MKKQKPAAEARGSRASTSWRERIRTRTRGAGCLYYDGIAGNEAIQDNAGRHLCFCVDGHYDSGPGAQYVDEPWKCPCGKWQEAA